MGDGTTTVVLLAGEFLREAKQFVEDGVHPQLIIRAYRTAATLAVATVREMSIRWARPRRAATRIRSACVRDRRLATHARRLRRSPNCA